MFVSKLTRYKH